MPSPQVPVQAVLQLEQFVSSCLDNGGHAVQDGTDRCVQLEKLRLLQSLLQDFRGLPPPGPVLAINDCFPQPRCESHALRDVNAVRDHTTMSASTASAPVEPLLPVPLNRRTPTSGQRGSTKNISHHASNMAAPYADAGFSDARGLGSGRSSDGLRLYRPSHEFRSDLSRMPDSDDAMFSSFMKTLDFVDPSDYPFGIRSSTSTTRLRNSFRPLGASITSIAASGCEQTPPAPPAQTWTSSGVDSDDVDELVRRECSRDEHGGQVCSDIEEPKMSISAWNQVLASMHSWQDFDVSSLAEQTCAPLRVTSLAAFEVLGLLKSLQIPRNQLQQYLQLIEALYPRSNPYHNSTHAADVVQALTCMLLKDHLVSHFSDLEILAMLIAAIVHDVGHPGVTNQFLRASKDDLSYMFSNKSVAENASLAIGLGLLANPRCNFLSHMDPETATSVESMTVTLVLNTDMMFHLTIIDDAERHAPRCTEEGMAAAALEGHDWPDNSHAARWLDSSFRAAAMSLLIHAADINSAGRRPAVAGMWAQAIYKEFFRQGDLEIEKGLPQTPFFQRDKVVIWKAQAIDVVKLTGMDVIKLNKRFHAAPLVSFAEKVVTPVFKALASLAPISAQIVLDNLESNVQKWKELGNADVSPLSVLNEPGTNAPKQLFVRSGEAVCQHGSRQCEPLSITVGGGTAL